MNTIEELVFELAEEHTSGDLEKLIRLLNLVLNGKKTLEAQVSGDVIAEPAPAPATRASKTKNAKATVGVESNDSSDDEPF
jgi:hypothetical protein